MDKAHHEGNARRAIEETLEFEKAVIRVNQVLWDLGITNETLLIVTGGHGHTMSINGYPDRNASILGKSELYKYGCRWSNDHIKVLLKNSRRKTPFKNLRTWRIKLLVVPSMGETT